MSVLINNVLLGEGRTKICVPIIGKTAEEILKEASELRDNDVDIVEWRVDFYEEVLDKEKVTGLIDSLTEVLEDKPVLFTFRTKAEGGERYIDILYYKMLLKAVINQGKVGAVDVELFIGEGVLEEISAYAKEHEVKVIASSHDFVRTPEKEEMVKRLIDMKERGADVSKIAVMPQSARDVLTLLEATEEVHRLRDDITLITMSMGSLGVISRISGGVFGSAMTFAAKSKELVSAPGQVEVRSLLDVLDVLGE